ncbi:MAG TPA: hypothetical protein VN735_02405 [Steroidobacteraceae bacterium]|nr:hypothetical protein [Steroidobacteraceae bacterium]
MSSDADTIDMSGAREVYKLLEELDGHINGQDANGRALLYQAKERIRMLIISIDRSNAERVSIPRAS